MVAGWQIEISAESIIMDVRYINPFIAAIKHLFKTMLDTDVVVSRPCVKSKGMRSSDVSAAIGFSGQAAGSVVLCFSRKVAGAVASKFAGDDISELNADLADALGELANMVAGQAKAKMDGLDISISLPRVAIGSVTTLQNSRIPILTLPCDSSLGRFSIEVSMELRKKSESIPADAAGATV